MHPLNSAIINIFHHELTIIVVQGKKDRDYNNLWFFRILLSLKVVLINIIAILMISTKLASSGYRERKVFWSKGPYIKIFVLVFTNKI